ncbi:unnamed protein product [Dibothriocephalus latus]|uniref:Uncharacterized protein n=1 Tax=Dibothriocephalus latus TaxID=60516 RepID=A0A3P7P9W5_DIBLA|nr:unnamed protein product [Dibothriocephalus latus]
MMSQALNRPFFIPGVVGQEWSPAATPLSTCLIPPFNGSNEIGRPSGSSALQFASPTSLIATSAASLPSMSPIPFAGFSSYMPFQGGVRNTEPAVVNTEQRVSMAFTAPSVRQPLSSVETVQNEIQLTHSCFLVAVWPSVRASAWTQKRGITPVFRSAIKMCRQAQLLHDGLTNDG